MKYLIYTVVPERCVLAEGQDPEPDLQYAAHAQDWLNLEVAVVGYGHGTVENLKYYPEAFTEGALAWNEQGNPARVARLFNEADVVIGFNPYLGEDLLLQANGLPASTQYDILCELLHQAGVESRPDGTYPGYSLGAIAKANSLPFKPLTDAPALWQRGEVEAVKAYAVASVNTLQKLLVLGLEGNLKDPVTGKLLGLPTVEAVLAMRGV